MMISGAARCFADGLRTALKRWPILAALYLGLLLPALGLAVRPAGLLWGLAERPVLRDIANGIPAWLIADSLGLMTRMQMTGSSAPVGLISGLRALTWAVLLLPLAGGLVSAFLYGGVLRAYSEPGPPLSWKSFFSGCWRWFGCFLILGLFQAVFFTLGLLILVLLVFWAFTRLGGWGGGLTLILLLLVLAAGSILFEVTRVQAVCTNTRNPFRAGERAASILTRHPGQVLSYYVLAIAVLLGLHGLYRLVVLPIIPEAVVVPALLAQQSFILLRLLARAGRLSGLVALTRSYELRG